MLLKARLFCYDTRMNKKTLEFLRRSFALPFALFWLGLISWCSGQETRPATTREGTASSPTFSSGSRSGGMKDYRIQPLDILSISVFQEKDLEREDVPVSQTGSITFPLIGKTQVVGLLISEVEILVARKLADGYIKNPQVSVIIKKYAPRRVSVLGQVKKPGVIEIPPEEKMTLMQAIARAEGFTSIAKTDAVLIRRNRPDGKIEEIKVNATELMKDGREKKDVDLEPGDVIVVPERFF